MRWEAQAPQPFFCLPGSDSRKQKSVYEKRRSRFALLVGDRRARWAGEVDDFEAFEADFAAPFAEVGAGVIERVAEFDQHVERHQQAVDILAPRVVDQGLDGDQRAARRQSVIGRADQVHLLLQIPVVQNHAHRDDVGLGQRVFEEIAGGSADAIAQSGGGDVFSRDGFDRRQIEADALEMRMFLRDFNAQQASRAADVAERLESRKIKFLRERLEVDAREAGHRAHELFELRQIRIELLKNPFVAVLDFVLRLPVRSASGRSFQNLNSRALSMTRMPPT